jgi:hypothetical protein
MLMGVAGGAPHSYKNSSRKLMASLGGAHSTGQAEVQLSHPPSRRSVIADGGGWEGPTQLQKLKQKKDGPPRKSRPYRAGCSAVDSPPLPKERHCRRGWLGGPDITTKTRPSKTNSCFIGREICTPAQNDALFNQASNSLSGNGFFGNLKASRQSILEFHQVSHWIFTAELTAAVATS